jgi:peptidoglycan/xylan/chitin deacetylase (PgdA/CDA1 family)
MIWTSRVDQLHLQALSPAATQDLRRRREALAASRTIKQALKTTAPADREKRLRELEETFAPGGRGVLAGEDRLLDWETIIALEREGLFEFGSHSRSHPMLTQLDSDALRAEISGSFADLRAHLRNPLPVLCYPDGDHDARVVQAAREAGYEAALTTIPGLINAETDCFRLPRIGVFSTTELSAFVCKVAGFGAATTKRS